MFLFSLEMGVQLFVRKTISELENDKQLISETTKLYFLNNFQDFKLTPIMNFKLFLELRKKRNAEW